MKVGVITFPGTLDDRDAQRAVRLAGHEPVALWHGEHDLHGVDALVLPGGFSYGDYLRCGAIAALSPIMTEVVEAATKGMPVLGICNGFQMLAEAHLLAGGLVRNETGLFVRRDQRLRVERTTTAWTNRFDEGQEIVIPAEERRGPLRRDARGGQAHRGRGARRLPLRGREPERLDRRHRRPHERGGQRRGPHAAPRARGRAGLRPTTTRMKAGLDGLDIFKSALEAVAA